MLCALLGPAEGSETYSLYDTSITETRSKFLNVQNQCRCIRVSAEPEV